jgi:hypothetical protein
VLPRAVFGLLARDLDREPQGVAQVSVLCHSVLGGKDSRFDVAEGEVRNRVAARLV